MSKLAFLVKKVAELDPITSRKVSCMVGAAVGGEFFEIIMHMF